MCKNPLHLSRLVSLAKLSFYFYFASLICIILFLLYVIVRVNKCRYDATEVVNKSLVFLIFLSLFLLGPLPFHLLICLIFIIVFVVSLLLPSRNLLIFQLMGIRFINLPWLRLQYSKFFPNISLVAEPAHIAHQNVLYFAFTYHF